MRKIKKIGHVFVATALCCMLMTPVGANAAIGNTLVCNHEMVRTIISEYADESEDDTHTYLVTCYDKEYQMWLEQDVECRRKYIHQISNYKCMCGLMRELNVHEIDVVHMNKECPER